MGIGKTFTVTHSVVMTMDLRRAERYIGLDLKGLKRKLTGAFSLAKALEFPIYKCFLALDEHKVDCYYYKPLGRTRTRSAPTLDKSTFNLLLNNLPGWAVLPKRETSAKVYSSINTANEYLKKSDGGVSHPGRMYRAVPVLNSQLFIAPAAHIRHSFQYALEQLGVASGGGELLGNVIFRFEELFVACGMEDEFPADWQSFLTALNDIAFERIQFTRNVSENAARLFAILGENKGHIVEFMDKAFSPLHNGFKLVKYDDQLKAEKYPDNEIWMASPCLLIEEELFKEMCSF